MRSCLAVLMLGLASAGSAHAQGLLVPSAKDVPPLAMTSHEVRVAIEDQAAVTHVVQTFRNHTSRALEATYVFPVPKGASVKKFVMWVNGKEVPGELVEADKARTIYTDIVRRTQDPGLLEYLGNNLMQVRVFPVPAHGEQKLAVSFTSLAPSDGGLIEYIYPLKADGKNGRALEKFTLEATLKAQHPIQNVYSPTHAIKIRRPNDREAIIHFESKHEALDKDFQLYYTATIKDVGLTALAHRPNRSEDGHFMLLISPRAELAQTQQVPRDIVFVLDTSGSMAGKRIMQARNALKYCLKDLHAKDSFGLIHFATSVTKYQEGLIPATQEQLDKAQHWVQGLQATGSTNIDEALAAALAMRSSDTGRGLTIVFFTDGQPTIGETNPQRIVQNVLAKNTANTRIFTFGVGDDVNTVFLDQLAEKTRSVSTYVRESEDIEAKVSNFYSKISQPVLTDLKLKVADDIKISEIYPPQLPDLFHGSQLVVLGRYHGKGHAAITLTGMVGDKRQEFDYEVKFPAYTKGEKAFVEDLWARRKVGYLLDQIRINGENKELKDEVVNLAKKHGIATPYTSYLVVPDTAPPPYVPTIAWTDYYKNHSYQINPGMQQRGIQFGPTFVTPQMQWAVPSNPSSPFPGIPSAALPFAHGADAAFVPRAGTGLNGGVISGLTPSGTLTPDLRPALLLSTATSAQFGKEGVDLAQQLSEMRNQDRVAKAAVRQAAGRKCLEINGVWADEGVDTKLPIVAIKAQSDAYFRMLERHPKMSEVFQLGNRVVWVTPSGTVLVIDATGAERLSDAEIDRLFIVKK